jgi:signal transduction histidine kinase
MDWLAELFETNRIIVLSVYGQVFFVLGLAVALQSRQRSELTLARPLGWLAAFGIVYALMEWGYLFVPIQAGFLPQPAVELLLLVQLGLKPISFALLFQFGAELVLSAHRGASVAGDRGPAAAAARPGRALGVGDRHGRALVHGCGRIHVPGRGRGCAPTRSDRRWPAVGAPLAVGDVVARALPCPAPRSSRSGLRRTRACSGRSPARGSSAPWVPAAVAFVAYALLAGLVPLPAPFPPASVLNRADRARDARRADRGLPLAHRPGHRSGVIRSLELFEQETDRALAEARRRELLLRERERIGRDLHDGIIQSIYAAGLHLEQASAEVGARPETAGERIGRSWAS